MRHRTGPRLAGAALILGIAVACTPASDQATAETELCTSLADFQTSVQTLGAVDPTTDSIEDVQADAAAAQEAWDQVLADAEGVQEADTTAVDAAWSGLADTITNFSTDEPLADAAAEVVTGVEEVQAAHDEMRNGLGCE